MLDIRRLALICEFARRGSIAATAAALGYTPSAVSQQLATLEREAGTALLDRTSRSAELTDAGRRLVVHAERILALVEEAEADLSAHASTPRGRVVVTAFPTAAVAFAPAVARSLRRHTELSMRLRQSRSGRGIREVQSGEVDIALVDDWYGRARGYDNLQVFPLLWDPLVLVVPRRHPMADPEGAPRPGEAAGRAVDGHPRGGTLPARRGPAARRRRRRPPGGVGVRGAGDHPRPGGQRARHRGGARPRPGLRGARDRGTDAARRADPPRGARGGAAVEPHRPSVAATLRAIHVAARLIAADLEHVKSLLPKS